MFSLVNRCCLLLALCSCSIVQKQAVNQMSHMMLDSSSNLTREAGLKYFSDSAAGNLKLIESLYYVKPNDYNLLTLLVKGHSGYAFSKFDTAYLNDKYNEKDFSIHKTRAIEHYTKSMDFGLEYLRLKGIEFSQLKSKDVTKVLEENLGRDDVRMLFYFAQSWGQIINYKRDNLNLVSEIVYVESLLNWACQKNPLFEEGICDIYKAVFEAQKPRLMGGDPKLAFELFKTAIKRYPKNLLIRVSLIEYLLIPTMNETEYFKQKRILQNEFYRWSKVLDYSRRGDKEMKYSWNDTNNLYNAMANKRFLIIKKFEKDLF